MAQGTLLLSFLLLLPQVSSPSQEEPLTESKRADIERLLQITTLPVLVQTVSDIAIKDITESLDVAMPGLPSAAKTAAIAETRLAVREFATEYLKELHPAYNRLFTQAEIRQVLAFYDSPIGQKLQQAAPAIGDEARALAVNRTRSLYPRVTQRVLERLQKDGFMKR